MKRVKTGIKIVLAFVVGIFVGSGIHLYHDYQSYPERFNTQSAPWYTEILLTGITTAVIVLIGIIVLTYLDKLEKKEKR